MGSAYLCYKSFYHFSEFSGSIDFELVRIHLIFKYDVHIKITHSTPWPSNEEQGVNIQNSLPIRRGKEGRLITSIQS